VALDDGLGRVLAGDLAARREQPPAAVSAMDGYAVRAADTEPAGRPLLVVGEVPAGGSHPRPLGPGEAVRIFTGGPLPDGADAVAIQENASVDGGEVRFAGPVAPGTFVRPAGLDFAQGWVGLRAGTPLDARALGLAAAMGHVWLPVRRRPRVGVLSTGDELCRPGEPLGPGQIVSSNSTTLCAAVRAWGCVPVDLGIAPDRPDALARGLAAAAGLDLLLTSGGASVGDYDIVGQALGGGAAGTELGFWKIAMRPGKPLLFGRTGDGVRVLGLPGNPVSASVCALVFARGAIRRMLGLEPELPRMAAVLARGLAANDRREDYVRARHVGRHPGGRRLVEVAERQDSSMFATFAAADALVVRPPHDPPRSEGDEVEVVDLRQAFLPFA
jgi:molybdopterin molybdotransferase